MRVLLCLFLFVFAQTGEGKDYDDYGAMAPYKNKPEFHQNYQEPVPFGHIMRGGFGDPFSPMKQPDLGAEIVMRKPRDKKEALELLKTAKRSQIRLSDPNVARFYSLRDTKEEMVNERIVNPQPEANDTLKWYDLVAMQGRNAALSPTHKRFVGKKKTTVRRPEVPPSAPGERAAYFKRQSFMLSKTDSDRNLSWTTCDQFAVGAIFAPVHVLNVKWTPFYIWDAHSPGETNAVEHTFEYPTIKLVKEYQLKFGKMVNETIDWTKPKLLLKGITEMLLIAADRKGLFHVIMKHELPDSAQTDNLKLPSLTFRLKMEDPYLVMTLCEEYYATVMAVSGTEPTEESEMIAEAATVKFIGPGRPVWRNFEAEREKLNSRMREDSKKNTANNDRVPPIDDWD